MVFEMRHIGGGVDAVDATTLGVLDATCRVEVNSPAGYPSLQFVGGIGEGRLF